MIAARWVIVCIALTMPWESVFAADEPRGTAPAQPTNPTGATPLRFRRVYAPAERVQEWPRGSTRYVPVDGEEFERLITAVAASSDESPVAATLNGARYDAEFKDSDHLQGQLSWSIENRAKSSTMMPVAPFNLAIGEARWSKPVRRAEIGLSASGDSALLVDSTGELTAPWSLRGKHDADGQPVFLFEFPACATTTLYLTVPQGIVPVASAGLVSQDRTEGDRQVYRILLGGQHTVTLRLTGEAAHAVSQPGATMREVSVYDFSTHGLDLATVWRLDARTAPLRRLTLSLDAGLQLVSARLGEVDVPFRIEPDSTEGATNVTLEPAEPLVGSDRPLRLAAIGPLVLDATRPLPRIRTADLGWQEGTSTLLVREPLVTRRLVTSDCRQTKYAVLPDPNRGESFEVQLFGEAAVVQLDLSRQSAPAQVSTGLSVELGDRAAQAGLIAAWQTASGRRSSLTADIVGSWSIDTIETIPADALEDWHVSIAEALPRLTVRLARPLAPDVPLKLVIRAHCRATADHDQKWQASDLVPLRFRDAIVDDQLLWIRPSSTHALDLADTVDLTRVEADQLSASQLALFSNHGPGFVYRIVPERTRFTATLAERRPQHEDEIHCDALVGSATLTESYTVRCRPAGDRVSNVLLAFSEPRPEPVRFRIVGDSGGSLVARRLSTSEQASRKLPATHEFWELTLAIPRGAAFEIEAVRDTPRMVETSLSLISLPDATSQSGQVVVRAAADLGISIRDEGVRLINVPESDTSTAARAAFSYDPADPAGRIIVAQDDTVLTPASAAVAWHRRVESRYDAAGHVLHVATYLLRNAGQSDLTLSIPETAEMSRLWLDGHQQMPPPGRLVSIPLEPDRSTSTLVVEYRSMGLKFDGGRLRSEFAELNIPVVASDWLLWLPPGYSLLSSTGGSTEPAANGLTWRKRLLGPLGPVTGDARFPLFSIDMWATQLGFSAPPSWRSAAEFASRFDDIANVLRVESPEATWGTLVTQAADAAHALGLELLVDSPALAAIDIAAGARVNAKSEASSSAETHDVLTDANLILLATPDAVLLSSCLTAAIQRNNIHWITPATLAMLETGPLRAAVNAAPDGTGIVPSTVWTAPGAAPWSMPAQVVSTSDGLAATPYLIPCDGSNQVEAAIVRDAAATTWVLASCVLMLATSLCLAISQRRLAMLLPLAAAVALVVPPNMASIATGCLWGIVSALAWQLIVPRVRIASRQADSTSGVSSIRWKSVASITPLALLTALVGITSLSRAQNPANESGATAPLVHRVFIPVDNKDKPTEDKYQVPEQLYDELHRRLENESQGDQGWLIRSARYRLTINREAASDTLGPSDVLAQYDVVVSKPDARVSIPMTGIRPGLTARREGREVDIPWDTDEDGFTCRFDEPGVYQLNVSLRPPRDAEAANALEMAIPPIPQATVEVQLPPNPPTVEVPTARGVATFSPDGRKVAVDLGPAAQLQIRWTRSRPARLNVASGEADIWLWLQIQPASVVVHARLDIKALKSPLTELLLSIDPRLRPLPVVDRSGTVASVQPVAGDPQTVRVELARAVTEHVTIPVSFLLTGSSGIGQLPLPNILPQGIPVRDRLLAISIDPTLQYDTQAPAPKIAVAEFLSHWGAAPAAPQWAIRLPEGEPWRIATRPREAQAFVKQRLQLSVGEHRALVRFQAQITPTEGQLPAAPYLLQYRLTAPRDLEIEKITLIHDGLDRVSRWARDEQGMITVFLSSPVSGRVQLTLNGQIAVALGSWNLPRVNVEYPGQHDTTVLVLRQPDTHVAWESGRGIVETERSRASDDVSLPGRVALALIAHNDDFLATLRVTRNTPQVRATQLTSLGRANDAWEGRVDFRASVADGCLDAVGFDLPAEWVGPFEVTPTAALETLPGSHSIRRLIVRPKTPLEGQQGFTLRSPLHLAADDPISIPEISGMSDKDVTSYLLLPTTMGSEHVVWKTHGLRPDSLPPDMIPPPLPNTYNVFRATEPTAHAQSSVARPDERTNEVSADIHALWNPSSACRGIATFVINGATRTDCQLSVPDGIEILELRASGLPVTPGKAARGWQIPLSPGRDRQTVEVVFRDASPAASQSDRISLTAPRLIEPEVTRTTWHIYGFGAGGTVQLVEPNGVVPQPWSYRDVGIRSDLPGALVNGASCTGRWLFSSDVPSITVQYLAPWSISTSGQWLAALLLTAAGAVIAWRLRGVAPPPLPLRTSGLAMSAVGLALVAWATPAWPGILLFAFGIAYACWPLVARKAVSAARMAEMPAVDVT
ncbi:MAG TPA: hypothetical protein VGG64_05280 [Pirellulales bacterium]|jgi:hypothetical protein